MSSKYLFRSIKDSKVNQYSNLDELIGIIEGIGLKAEPRDINFKLHGYDPEFGINSFLISVNGKTVGYSNTALIIKNLI